MKLAVIAIISLFIFIGIAFIIYLLVRKKPIDKSTIVTNSNDIPKLRETWGFYKNGNKCLSVVGMGEINDNIVVAECDGSNKQIWKLTKDMTLVHYGDNLCLDPAGYDAAYGVNIGLFTCDAGAAAGGDQRWYVQFNPKDKSKIKFINQLSNDCMDITTTVGNAPSNVMIGDCIDYASGNWSFYPSPKNLV